MENKVPFRITALIHRVSIQKNIQFDCKVVWKRHNNKTETKQVKHAHGFSIFQEKLVLDFKLPIQNNKVKQKNFLILISLDGKSKSGGIGKYDVSNIINSQQTQSTQKILLKDCPDRQAYIQVSFSYEKLQQNFQINESMMSMMNASSKDLNYSRFVLNEKSKIQCQIDKIKMLLDTFEELNAEIKDGNSVQSQSITPEVKKKMEIIEGQNKTLQAQISSLQRRLEKQSQQFKQQRKLLTKQMIDLEKQFNKKSAKGKDNAQNYKQLYEKSLQELQEIKSITLQQSLNQVIETTISPTKKLTNKQKSQLQRLQKQNHQLQNQVAEMSHKLATLFNASVTYGGSQLLDYLQTSIGIIQ